MSITARMIQLLPADHWFAALAINDAPFLQLERLIAFCLVETKDGTAIDGIEKNLTMCMTGYMDIEESTNKWKSPHFMGFYHNDDLTEEKRAKLLQSAKDYFR